MKYGPRRGVEPAWGPFSGDSPVGIAAITGGGDHLLIERMEAVDDFDRDVVGLAGETDAGNAFNRRWSTCATDTFLLATWDATSGTLRLKSIRCTSVALRNELRWLIFKGWIAHGFEKPSRSTNHRCFVEAGPGWFDKTSCFTLTASGADILGRWSSVAPALPAAVEPAVPGADRSQVGPAAARAAARPISDQAVQSAGQHSKHGAGHL